MVKDNCISDSPASIYHNSRHKHWMWIIRVQMIRGATLYCRLLVWLVEISGFKVFARCRGESESQKHLVKAWWQHKQTVNACGTFRTRPTDQLMNTLHGIFVVMNQTSAHIYRYYQHVFTYVLMNLTSECNLGRPSKSSQNESLSLHMITKCLLPD